MSVTLSDLLTSLAYRFDEDNSPDNASEKAKRTKALNEGYRKAIQANNYWFAQDVYSMRGIADTEIYTLPSNFREMIEIRVDEGDNIVRYPILPEQAFNFYSYPPIAMTYKYDYDSKYYMSGMMNCIYSL